MPFQMEFNQWKFEGSAFGENSEEIFYGIIYSEVVSGYRKKKNWTLPIPQSKLNQ